MTEATVLRGVCIIAAMIILVFCGIDMLLSFSHRDRPSPFTYQWIAMSGGLSLLANACRP